VRPIVVALACVAALHASGCRTSASSAPATSDAPKGRAARRPPPPTATLEQLAALGCDDAPPDAPAIHAAPAHHVPPAAPRVLDVRRPLDLHAPTSEAYRVATWSGLRGTSPAGLVSRDEGHVRLLAYEDDGTDEGRRVDRPLRDDEWATIMAAVDASGFWEGARLESEPHVLDGWAVDLEGLRVGELRAVSAPNPLLGPMHDLVSTILRVARAPVDDAVD